MPPARSHTNSEIVPGVLPWISSCCGAVTIASATSGTVSDTREIAEPTLRMVERPTSRSTVVAAAAMPVGLEPEKATGCWACGVATRTTMM
jgi:hypothetical protein